MSKYTEQADKFLEQTGTKFDAEYLRHDKYFPDDKEKRDIYQITLTRGERKYTFTFGQSIQASGEFKITDCHLQEKLGKSFLTFAEMYCMSKKDKTKKYSRYQKGVEVEENKDYAIPCAYDVLATVTKYDPGAFQDFCSEYGYDEDSIKANKAYDAVRNEYIELTRLYSDSELELMQDIQ